MSTQTFRPSKSNPVATASFRTAFADMYRGFIELTHNGMALLGGLLAVGCIALAARGDLRDSAEQHILGWLLQRQETVQVVEQPEPEPDSVERVTALPPNQLPKQQANVAHWLSRKYRVAPEPLSALVAEAFSVGEKVRMDPTLILAVMAIESRFNPYAQSPVGAQGLMQVLTRVHTDKYEGFGGQMAAFDPLANLRVGVKVLQDCIKQAGSVEGGLRLYVGAVTTDGSDYINKVMAEHLRIQSVALGRPMPTSFPVYSAAPPPHRSNQKYPFRPRLDCWRSQRPASPLLSPQPPPPLLICPSPEPTPGRGLRRACGEMQPRSDKLPPVRDWR